MDQILQSAFLARTKPFSRLTLKSTPDLSPRQLLSVLRLTSRFVDTYYHDTELRVLDDWHAHDCYITNSSPTTLADIAKWLESEEALLASDVGESYVQKAVYATSLEFLWRWNIEDETMLQDGDLWCSFDFTGPEHDICELSKYLSEVKEKIFQRVPASEYFAQSYAG